MLSGASMFNQPCQNWVVVWHLSSIACFQGTSECPGLRFNCLNCSFNFPFGFWDSFGNFFQNQLFVKTILGCLNYGVECRLWVMSHDHLGVPKLLKVIQKTFGSNRTLGNSLVWQNVRIGQFGPSIMYYQNWCMLILHFFCDDSVIYWIHKTIVSWDHRNCLIWMIYSGMSRCLCLTSNAMFTPTPKRIMADKMLFFFSLRRRCCSW